MLVYQVLHMADESRGDWSPSMVRLQSYRSWRTMRETRCPSDTTGVLTAGSVTHQPANWYTACPHVWCVHSHCPTVQKQLQDKRDGSLTKIPRDEAGVLSLLSLASMSAP